MRRTKTLGCGLALVAAVGCAFDASQDDGFGYEFAEGAITVGTTYTLVGVESNKCVQFATSADLAEAQISTCDGSTRQQWRFESMGSGYFRVRNVASNKCLDVEGNSTANEARIVQWGCGSAGNQQWQLNESGGLARLIGRNSGKAADVLGHGTANGTRLIQWTFTDTPNQQFRPTVVGSGSSGGSAGSGGTAGTAGTAGTSGTAGKGGSGGTAGSTGSGGAFSCASGSSGYNAVVTKSGSTWTALRGSTTLYTGTDTRAAIQAGIDGLSAGRTSKQSVLVQGDGSISAGSRISLASYTVLNVCGTLNVTGTGTGDQAPIYARGRTDVEVPNVKITGTPLYGMFFRETNNIRLGNVDLRVSGGLGIRIDNGSSHPVNKVQNVQIDNVYVEGTGTHGVETYGVNNIQIGTVVARRTHDAGLLLNDTTNATVGLVDAQDAGTGTGYAAFRMANRNGRIDNAYPTNIRVGQVIARGGGRGIFCVSESGGAVIDRIDLTDNGNNSILIENCYNVNIAAVSGSVTRGGGIRLAARAEFPNSSDITIQNLTLTSTSVTESPCATNSIFRNNTLVSSSLNVCP